MVSAVQPKAQFRLVFQHAGQQLIKTVQQRPLAALLRICGKLRLQRDVVLRKAQPFDIQIVQAQKRVLIQQKFCGIGQIAFSVQKRRFVERADARQRPPVRARAGGEPAADVPAVHPAGIAELRPGLQAQQHRLRARLSAVVAPCGDHHIRHAVSEAGTQRGLRFFEKHVIVNGRAQPRPHTARKPQRRGKFLVQADVSVVERLVVVVIIPIYQRHVRGRGVYYRLGDLDVVLVVIIVGAGAAEIHVAPHHWLKAVLSGQRAHALHMAQHNVKALVIAVLFQVPAQAQIHGFVHAQVYFFRAVACAAPAQHGLDQPVGFLVPGQQHIRRIPQRRAAFPMQKTFQMPQRLDAGDQFDAQRRRPTVQRTQILGAVPSPLVAEKRIFRQRIGILRI